MSPRLSASQNIQTVNVTMHNSKKCAAILSPANIIFPIIKQPKVIDHNHASTTIIHILAKGSGMFFNGFLL